MANLDDGLNFSLIAICYFSAKLNYLWLILLFHCRNLFKFKYNLPKEEFMVFLNLNRSWECIYLKKKTQTFLRLKTLKVSHLVSLKLQKCTFAMLITSYFIITVTIKNQSNFTEYLISTFRNSEKRMICKHSSEQ